MMRLVRFHGWRTGLVVRRPAGIYIIDVAASVGALLPEDPISNGVLNGILSDRGSWAPLIAHWESVRLGLRRLTQLALRVPDHPGLIMYRFDEADVLSSPSKWDSIAALEIAELSEVTLDRREPPIENHAADDRVVALDSFRK